MIMNIFKFLYPWIRDERPEVTPMTGIYRKSFEDNGKKIMIFVMKDDPYSEMKFFIDGNQVYTVSFNTFEDLIDGVKKAENDFRDGFLITFLEAQSKIENPEQYLSCDRLRLKMLGYN